MVTFKQSLKDIKNDLPSGSATFKSILYNYFFSPRFRILLNHRLGKYFQQQNSSLFYLISKYYKKRLIVKWNCDISYNATIGKNLRLPHPFGIVIGEGVIIKDNVMIFQQVTFGSHGRKGRDFKYPTVGDNVKIYAGAKIIGGITIGENAIIGANAVVNIDVPANSKAVGVPCRILS